MPIPHFAAIICIQNEEKEEIMLVCNSCHLISENEVVCENCGSEDLIDGVECGNCCCLDHPDSMNYLGLCGSDQNDCAGDEEICDEVHDGFVSIFLANI